MARLNESSTSAESIEILKRRFVRQNREIARVNSIQSLRIRSLESEVSHLLSENVSLREQIITVTQELERLEAAKALHDGVYKLQAKLDSKMVELSSLVTELGSLPRQYSRAARAMAESKPEPAFEERLRRSSSANQAIGCTDPEPNSDFEADGRLPVILEDKYYPRRTLEAHELQQLSNGAAEAESAAELKDSTTTPRNSTTTPRHSTECDEPPTVALEDVADAKPLDEHVQEEHSLPPNLETRRKKRATPAVVNEERPDPDTISFLDSKFMRKCGAKRKFFAEDEESIFESAPAEYDDFEFSRPIRSPTKLPSQSDHSPVRQRSQSRMGRVGIGQPTRKVLEAKSTNVSLRSPAKPVIAKGYDQPQISVTPRECPLSKQGKYMTPKQPTTSTYDSGRGVAYEANQMNAEIKRHTAPLQDFDCNLPATADMPNSRPSRRQRSIISYTEPNLRDKMRRSTNELGPAVGRDKPRKSSSLADSSREQGIKDGPTKVALNPESVGGEPDLADTDTLASHPTPQPSMVSQWKRKTSGQAVDDGREFTAVNQSLGLEDSSDRSEGEPYDWLTTQSSQSHGSTQDEPQIPACNESGIPHQVGPSATRNSRLQPSNRRTSGRRTIPRFSTSAMNLEAEYNDLAPSHAQSVTNETPMPGTNNSEHPTGNSHEYNGSSLSTGSREMKRGRRVAARRKSMML
ncbi:shugoshin family protein [Aspergillus lucknowensis]|uniref:Shugoshin n=1 Tax=Aspergillus lucknowensis TaxID=176173 RepID=A0ABR4M6K7_9EURO